MNRLIAPLAALALAACQAQSPEAPLPMPEATPSARLAAVLAAQDEEIRARYRYRHPQETLEFFGIEPGMTVVEALPGGGWYSRILVDYLGPSGRLVGADYDAAMWPKFGFFSDEFIEKKKTWTTAWPREAAQWRGADGAPVSAFVFGSLPASTVGTADAVLFIRAMHNLSRFDDDGGFFAGAIDDAWRALKPGGIVGVVQHAAPEAMDAAWAKGARGYLHEADVIARMEDRGFELVGRSDVNRNPRDIPGADDVVWRLPPALNNSKDDPALRERMAAIGESDRMTLRFRKPD